jgi:DNA-binding NarL/FixJ family response regulator
MTSSGEKPRPSSPVAQRKSRKTDKVKLHASQNDENTAVALDALAGGLTGLEADLVLVDISLPHRSGINLVMSLQLMYPDLPCIMLSGPVSQYYARRSLSAGARGYLLKDHTEEILMGIQRVLQGEIYVSEEVK